MQTDISMDGIYHYENQEGDRDLHAVDAMHYMWVVLLLFNKIILM